MATVRRRALITTALGVVGALGLAGAATAMSAAAPGDRPTAPAAGRPTPAEVEATRRALDARAASVPASVVSWGVDPAIGLVVVEISGARDAAVDEFLAGLDARTYRVETGTPAVQPFPR